MKKLTIILLVMAFAVFSAPLYLCPINVQAAESADPASKANITVLMPEAATEPEPALVVPVAEDGADTVLYPVSVVENREGGRREIIRVYELTETENPNYIPRESFEREGYRYELAEIIKSELLAFDSREHVEAITVSTDTKDLETVMKMLAQTVEYQSEDGFIGILTLDVSTITIESAGTKKSTSTASRTREYPHLSSSDLSLVPKTITDGGKTYDLANVEWRSGNTEAVDYTQLPQSYTAVATYTASYTRTTDVGYNTIAEYKGVISKTSQGLTRYTANFIGIPIVMPVVTLDAEETPSPELAAVTEAEPAPAAGTEAQADAEGALPAGTAAGDVKAGDEAAGDTTPAEAQPASDSSDEPAEAETAADTDINGEITTDAPEDSEAEKKPFTVSPAVLIVLLCVVAATSYFAGKYGKKAFAKLKKPACMALIAAAFLSVPQSAFANVISQLPSYGFGNSNTENTLHFDIAVTDSLTSAAPVTHSPPGSIISAPVYKDGDLIGTLTIEKSGKSVGVYEGASLASMSKGGGRFSSAGINSGNTAVIGHNRGRNGHFSFVKGLNEGDILTLDAGGVIKAYAVSFTHTVSAADFSPLTQFGDSRLTLITCLENQRDMRRVAVALEI